FFSGIVFPVENLPKTLIYAAEVIPLTHVVRIARAFCVPGLLNFHLLLDLGYCILFTVLFGWLAVKGIKKRLIV
ncbi:MAG: lipooligosaccharide transport system permease protein, partial [Acidobacteriota bacterium]|nr:lipooligosaccharide transport system permease protein [Acidobacteriota bacterium]